MAKEDELKVTDERLFPNEEAKAEDRDDFTPDEPAHAAAPPSERERCLEVVRRVLLGEPRPHSLEDACARIEKELSGGAE